jgi:hypothetical protein
MTLFSPRRHTRGLGLSPGRSRAAGAGSPGDSQAPSGPQNLVATAVSCSPIGLTWDASTDEVAVAGYILYGTARTNQQQAQKRAALTSILAARSKTLP